MSDESRYGLGPLYDFRDYGFSVDLGEIVSRLVCEAFVEFGKGYWSLQDNGDLLWRSDLSDAGDADACEVSVSAAQFSEAIDDRLRYLTTDAEHIRSQEQLDYFVDESVKGLNALSQWRMAIENAEAKFAAFKAALRLR